MTDANPEHAREPQRITPMVKLVVGDRLALRKAHPCGANDWEVVRIGADIRLLCRECQRSVLLPRVQLARRLKRFLSTADGRPTERT